MTNETTNTLALLRAIFGKHLRNVAEVICTHRLLTLEEQAELVDHLRQKWGLS